MLKSMLILICSLWILGEAEETVKNKLLLISFDGFRYDYIDRYTPKHFMRLIEEGVHASSGMIPVFPTKTFPNHYSLVTGLYPESHGVVDNNMYDPDLNESFQLNVNTESKWFDQAEPLWITATLKGIKSGVHFWPGSSTAIHGTKANFYEEFNGTIPFNKRVDDVIRWFKDHDVTFGVLYFEEPDTKGHQYGVYSNEVQKMVAAVDNTLGYILQQLENYNLYKSTDIIIVSDHGMVNTSRNISENMILDNYLTQEDVSVIAQTGTLASIMPREGKLEEVYKKLKNANPNVKVYYKEEIPERLHYRNNKRILPIIAIANEHYQIMKNDNEFYGSSLGQHGYDNILTSMKPIFIAAGPHFKSKVTMDPFQNFNTYSLMCHILGIEEKPNNGTLQVFKDVLKEAASSSPSSAVSFKFQLTGMNIVTTLIFSFIVRTLLLYSV